MNLQKPLYCQISLWPSIRMIPCNVWMTKIAVYKIYILFKRNNRWQNCFHKCPEFRLFSRFLPFVFMLWWQKKIKLFFIVFLIIDSKFKCFPNIWKFHQYKCLHVNLFCIILPTLSIEHSSLWANLLPDWQHWTTLEYVQ